ncbi:MAG: patatin-like phospholipase family protein [Burkholderiales bacterium]|nr:patatin-like phospholipase family protein [Burkholderiales bacterium]
MTQLNLALQGGGSHGAFTWGVLDALLEDGRVRPEGLSGTSAGAVNAVALASGWAAAEAAGRDPRQGARDALARVWGGVAAWGPVAAWPAALAGQLWGGMLSPYQSNPLDFNPLRDLLAAEIDFEAIAAHPRLRVFVSATQVTTGKAVLFTGRRLALDAVLASCCLPMLFKAVEIDGEAYWDGGYSVNPALSPLIRSCESGDLMLVQLNPLKGEGTPRTPDAIANRIHQLHFNASLLTQMRAIDFLNRLHADGAVTPRRVKAVRVHRIDGTEATGAYPSSSRGSPDGSMIRELFAAGQASARQWLAQHFHALGRHTTVDIERDYLDDTRVELPRPRWPWLRRLFPRRPG